MFMLQRMGARIAAVIAVVIVAATTAAGGAGRASTAGQLLVATPQMADPRFAQTVIYMVTHDAGGAMGLVVNKAYGEGPLNELLAGFGIDNALTGERVRLHFGGPVEPGRGFVLHSADYLGTSTRRLAPDVALSIGTDVLQAVAAGGGPKQRLFIIGYAGWSPGQLDREIARDGWLTAPADPSLIFSADLDGLWQQALARAGTAL